MIAKMISKREVDEHSLRFSVCFMYHVEVIRKNSHSVWSQALGVRLE